jgi:hypothetical protein
VNCVDLIRRLNQTKLPETISVSPPEGFSYYGLNPRDFIDLALHIGRVGEPAAVIGIRSIGVTLSAVVAAALDSPEFHVDRISIRPSGHPYDRVACFKPDQIRWIQKHYARGSQFLIVDEGPGRSGSTFLSVAEALVACEIPRDRITLLGSRLPVPAELCTEAAEDRWSRFKFHPIETRSCERFRGHPYLGGGQWRRLFIADETAWPASWPQMERSKFLSPDGNWLFKFDGMGRIGEEVRDRAQVLSRTGLGCSIQEAVDGYSRYQVVDGRPLRTSDISSEILNHIARYCGMRSSEFQMTTKQGEPLSNMVKFNIQQEFNSDCIVTEQDLSIEKLIIADGRMQPHEWLMTTSGVILKSDAASHGDDHFFPGPTDIAWDVAGTIIEWTLEGDARAFFIDRFERISGRKLGRQLDAYCLAYSIFRMGVCAMAIPTTSLDEQKRLNRDYDRYRHAATKFLQPFVIADRKSTYQVTGQEQVA